MSHTPPEMRNWRARLVTRAVHTYFAYVRGMTMGVRAACFDMEGRIFLIRHTYVPGWMMPGGGIERNETAGQALIKEIREEGNLTLGDPPELMHVFHNRNTSRRDHVLFYRCRNVVQTAPKQRDREILESGFFRLDALPESTTSATLRRLDELFGKAPFSDIW